MAGVRSKRRSSGKFQGWFTDYMGERKWFDGTRSRAETLYQCASHELTFLRSHRPFIADSPH
jgi:hypothetical protein